MRKNILVVLLLLSVATIAMAQPKPAPACPNLDVIAPATVTAGEKIKVTCAVSGGDPNITPTYNWAITDGIIEEGQGTSTITIDVSEATSTFITATVDVGGYDRECTTSDSSSTEILPKENEDEPAPEEPQKPPR